MDKKQILAEINLTRHWCQNYYRENIDIIIFTCVVQIKIKTFTHPRQQRFHCRLIVFMMFMFMPMLMFIPMFMFMPMSEYEQATSAH